MHTLEFVSAGCAVVVMALAYAFVLCRKQAQKTANRPKMTDAKMLPPDQFCKKVLAAKPKRMIIVQVSHANGAPRNSRRYEFRAEEPKSGKGFRTYFDATGEPVQKNASSNMRRAVISIKQLMQAADWHLEGRKGIITNPAFYLEP